MHVQNLTDDKLPTWRHGRGWAGRWRVEWNVFRPNSSWGVYVRKGGYDDNEISFHLAVPFLALWLSRSFDRCFSERELSVAWHDGSLWIKLWCDDEWHRDRPWHRNTISLNVAEWITGRPKFVMTTGDPVPVVVPMPEGCYRATVKPQDCEWTYRFGFKRTRPGYWLEVTDRGGIPFSGKGENSWDCGDDGLCGIGGDTAEEAIGNAVASVLRSRRRYGQTNETRGRVVMARPDTPSPSET